MSLPKNPLPEADATPDDAKGLTRRSFLKAAGVIAAAAGTGAPVVIPAAQTILPESISTPPVPIVSQYPEVPAPPLTPPPDDVLVFFTPQEARTLDAIVSRIIPGSADDPGAHEAGVVNYIDKAMAFNEGFDEPAYRQAPFAQVYEGDAPPDSAHAGPYRTVWVAKGQIGRYGFQSILSPREIYRAALAAIDRYAQSQHQGNFADLSADQQDAILTDMESGKLPDTPFLSSSDLFNFIRTDTINGMFSDPAYGGNRDMAGWNLVGYPGAQRAYSADDINREDVQRPPQDLSRLHALMPPPADSEGDSSSHDSMTMSD